MWKSGSRGALLTPLLLGAALLTACGLLPSNQAPEIPTESYTVTVQPGQSIQEAIDAAPARAVIRLGEGEWEENLEITKDLTLKGAGPGKTVIKNPRSRDTPGILIGNRAKVCIEGVTICSSEGYYDVDPEGWPAIEIYYGCAVKIKNSSILRNSGPGIWLSYSANLDIENSKIAENGADGIQTSGSVIIRDSSIMNNAGNGILADVYTNESLRLEGSNITGNEGDGVLYVVDILGVNVEMQEILELLGDTISTNGGNGFEVNIVIMPPPVVPTVSPDAFPTAIADVHMALNGNTIVNNMGYGTDFEEMFESEYVCFTGEIRGRANTIQGNTAGDIRPWYLEFLATPEGGCYGSGCEAGRN